eukprot:scaffold56524_cov48-Phaeocystis_antarctica.AAC.2
MPAGRGADQVRPRCGRGAAGGGGGGAGHTTERVSHRVAPQAEGVWSGWSSGPCRDKGAAAAWGRPGRGGTGKGGAVVMVGGAAAASTSLGVQHLRCVPEPPNLTLLCGARGRGGGVSHRARGRPPRHARACTGAECSPDRRRRRRSRRGCSRGTRRNAAGAPSSGRPSHGATARPPSAAMTGRSPCCLRVLWPSPGTLQACVAWPCLWRPGRRRRRSPPLPSWAPPPRHSCRLLRPPWRPPSCQREWRARRSREMRARRRGLELAVVP